MNKLNKYINRYIGLILLSSAIPGLLIPEISMDISDLIIVSLATILFASYFRIDLSRQMLLSDWKQISIFFLIRYIMLSSIVFYVTLPISNFYATSFCLLLILPAAVSSPAFAGIFKGRMSLSIKILIFTSFVSIITIPLISKLILSQAVEIDSLQMFLMLVYTVVLPFVLHLPFRKSKKITEGVSNNIPVITAIGLMVIFIFSISKNKEVILSDPIKVIGYSIISLVFFIILYLIGYYLMFRTGKVNRIAYSITSGANNIGMGVTITMLFFTPETNIFFIIAQLAWIFALIPMRFFYDYMLKKDSAI